MVNRGEITKTRAQDAAAKLDRHLIFIAICGPLRPCGAILLNSVAIHKQSCAQSAIRPVMGALPPALTATYLSGTRY
jgi:hypothetical protein